MTSLKCYKIHENPCPLVPARSNRAWMDDTELRFAYRCLPLSIANAMGWELLLPADIVATWNGSDDLDAVTVDVQDPDYDGPKIAGSHFGSGIMTFHIPYLFRTEPGVGLWARGAPNWPKDEIAPLEGIIETDWLSFTFTMNWKFTRPGTVTFKKGEPFCFLSLIPYHAHSDIQPEVLSIEEAPEIAAEFREWRDKREDFNKRLMAQEPEIVKQGWQKWYIRGQKPDGSKGNQNHVSNLKLASPKTVDVDNSG